MILNDRELLELAAKAAGVSLEWNAGSPVDVFERWSGNPSEPPEQDHRDWNPLTDDGDALRLAMRINACVVIDNEMKWCGIHLNGSRGKYDIFEPFGAHPEAATRRAIVLAAAEIGKSAAPSVART